MGGGASAYLEQDDLDGEHGGGAMVPNPVASAIRSAANRDSDVTLSKPEPTRLKLAAYLELNPNKTLTGMVRIFGRPNDPVDISTLSGMYAFCILERKTEVEHKQYLLVCPLKNYESNHTLFNLHLKRVAGYDAATSKVLAGGEIVFDPKTTKVLWNLKSVGYSIDGQFDERKSSPEQYKSLLALLWLPNDDNNYISIELSKNLVLQSMFTPSGSFKRNSDVSTQNEICANTETSVSALDDHRVYSSIPCNG